MPGERITYSAKHRRGVRDQTAAAAGPSTDPFRATDLSANPAAGFVAGPSTSLEASHIPGLAGYPSAPERFRIGKARRLAAEHAKNLAAEHAKKLHLTEKEYKKVIQAHKDEYQSDFEYDTDEEDAFVAIFDQSTRRLKLPPTQHALPAAPLPKDFSRGDLHKVKKEWNDVYNSQGRHGLAEALVMEDFDARLAERHALVSEDRVWASQAMHNVLLSMPHALIKSIMCGNLSSDKRNDHDLAKELAKIREQSKNQPSIYHQSLVDTDGLSPSPNELLEMLDYMEQYMKACSMSDDPDETRTISVKPLDRKTMCSLDNYKNFVRKKLDEAWANRVHFAKYMWHTVEVPVPSPSTSISAATAKGKGKATSKGKGKAKATTSSPAASGSEEYDSDSDAARAKTKKNKGKTMMVWKYCKAHVIETRAFVAALRKRISEIDAADMDKPLYFPLVEVGYAKNSIERLRSHKAHRSSNYIMNLMETLFAKFGPQVRLGVKTEPKYRIEQEIVALIWKVDQAEISEIGLTKLAEGYIHNAGGFSHFPAGLSNDSAHRLRPKVWSAAQEWTMKHSCYTKNKTEELDALRLEVTRAEQLNLEISQQTSKYEHQDAESQSQVFNVIKQACNSHDYLANYKSASGEATLSEEAQRLVQELEETVPMIALSPSRITVSRQKAGQLLGLCRDVYVLREAIDELSAAAKGPIETNPEWDDADDMDPAKLGAMISGLGEVSAVEDADDETGPMDLDSRGMQGGEMMEEDQDEADSDGEGVNEDGSESDAGEGEAEEDDDLFAALENTAAVQQSFADSALGIDVSKALSNKPIPLDQIME